MSIETVHNLKIKKAWEVSLSGVKSIPMNMFMLYMSGNSIQIFSILITVMLFWNSFKAIMDVNQVFEKFGISIETGSHLKKSGLSEYFDPQSNPLLLPKIVYILVQAGNGALGTLRI